MLDVFRLQPGFDPLPHSSLLAGLVEMLRHAQDEGGIALTPGNRMSRKFVAHALNTLRFPGYSPAELRSLAQEGDDLAVPALFDLRETATALGLIRRRSGRLVITKRGREALAEPQALWPDMVAFHLYGLTEDDLIDIPDVRALRRDWEMLYPEIARLAQPGFSLGALEEAYFRPGGVGMLLRAEEEERLMVLRIEILEPLCWLGVLREEASFLPDERQLRYRKTPLWDAVRGFARLGRG